MSVTFFPGVFGPDQWHCLEFFADETEAGRVTLKRFHAYVEAMAQLLPCSLCRGHLQQNLKLFPLPSMSTSCRKWVCDVHNSVNRSNNVSEVALKDVKPRDPPLHKQFRLLMLYAGFVQELDRPLERVFWTYAREALRLFGLCLHGPQTTPVRWVSAQAQKVGLHIDDTLFDTMEDLEGDLVNNFEARQRDRVEILKLYARLGLPTRLVGLSATLGQVWTREDDLVLLPLGVRFDDVGARDQHECLGQGLRLCALDEVLAVADDERVYVHNRDGLISPIAKQATCLRVLGKRVYVGTTEGGWVYSERELHRFHGPDEVTAISPDATVWATKHGVYNMDGMVTPTLDAVDRITAVDTRAGRVVIGTEEGRVFVLDPLSTLEPVVELDTAHRPIAAVCLTAHGAVWFDGLWVGGAYRGMSTLTQVSIVNNALVLEVGVDGLVTMPIAT